MLPGCGTHYMLWCVVFHGMLWVWGVFVAGFGVCGRGCSYLLGSHYHGSMLFAFSVAPTVSDPDGSVHRAVADAVAIVRASGLPHQTGPMFTTIEGEWDECMDVIRRATEAVGKHGPRVSLVIKADIRPGHDHGEIEGKVQRLNAAIEQLDSGK